MKRCSICRKEVNAESAAILTMGGFGNPKYLCDDCAQVMDTVTGGKDPDQIEEGMQKITKLISAAAVDDKIVLDTVTEIFSDAGNRAKMIRDGSYDFAKDSEEEVIDDVPEELRESEEDKALDEAEARTSKKIDKVLNWITAAVFVGAVAFMVVYFLL